MKRWLSIVSLVLLIAVLAVGCGGPKESADQKLQDFKEAHAAIYDAWAATTLTDLKDRLAKGLADPLLTEQVNQQQPVMQQRIMMSEKHVVKSITFNQLEISKDGDDQFEVYADWTVDGYRDHGDVHEMKVSYKKHFHLVKQEGKWKIDKIFE